MTALPTSPRSWRCDRCGAVAEWDYEPDPDDPDPSLLKNESVDSLGGCAHGWYSYEPFCSAGCHVVNMVADPLWPGNYVPCKHDNNWRWHLCPTCDAALVEWLQDLRARELEMGIDGRETVETDL